MQSITARQVFQMPRQSVWQLTEGEYEVLYEDNEVRTNTARQLIFNRYCWDMFVHHPDVPITVQCDVKTAIGKDFFNATTHIKLLQSIFQHICFYKGILSYTDKHPLLRTIYDIVDNIHNEVICGISEYVTTIDAVDFVDVIRAPELVAAAAEMRPTPEGVEKAYKQIKHYVSSAKGSNRFVQAYRAKAINENQSNQCIGPRGFGTGLDRTVFKQPITSGFIKGMASLYEIMVESCTAAKALNASGTHIQTSEYTSRRVQLLAMVVKSVVNTDCGSQEYMDIFITPPVLENLKGIHYLKDDGTLGCLQGDESHLFDKIIKIRTALGCKLHDSSQVCSTCLGTLSQNFSESTNLGYTMAAFLMEMVTQAILSTKHLTHSVRKSFIKLEGLANRYFYTDENSDVFFHADLKLDNLELILPNASVSRLVDVLNLPHTNIGLSKIGELASVIIRDNNHKTPTSDKLDISYNDRNCVITRSLLLHIKSVNMESDSRGNFVIPLDTYDKTKAIFNNPLKEANIINFVNKVASIIETTSAKDSDPYEKLNLLFSTVTDKFKCNLTVLQVLVYATTAFNAANGNYKLGRNSPTVTSENKAMLFRHRDFAGLAVFQQQTTELILHASTAFGKNIPRQDHPMNIFFTPSDLV
jgi:hypothetical protein